MYILKTFPSKSLSVKKVSGHILASMEKVEKQVLKDFEKTTETWTEHKGETNFEHKFYFAGGNAIITVWTSGEIWNYLNGGTSVRFATMEPGFRRKTTPGVVGSVPGRGKMLFVSKKIPHKGIDARRWTEVIADKFDDVLKVELDAAIQRGMQP